MARINIEDSLFKDGRFIDLAIAMGSRHAALGAVIEAFMLAQEFYLNTSTDRMIPLTEWNRRKAVGLVIDVGLAELKGKDKDLIYVCGAEKQFAWLLQRQDAGAKGGRPKNENQPNQNKPQEKKPEESGRLAEQSGSNPPTLSLTPTLSLISNSNSSSDLNSLSKDNPSKKPKKKSTPEDRENNRKIKNAYVDAYRLRYGVEPLTENVVFNSQVAKARELVGTEQAQQLVRFYLTHQDGKYLKNTHSFNFFLLDIATLRTQMLKGRAITGKMVRDFENRTHDKNAEVRAQIESELKNESAD